MSCPSQFSWQNDIWCATLYATLKLPRVHHQSFVEAGHTPCVIIGSLLSSNWILPSSRLLRSVRWFETVVSELPICPSFKGQKVQETWPSKIEPTGSPKTSVLNQLTPPNNPEDGRIQVTLQFEIRFLFDLRSYSLFVGVRNVETFCA